VRIASRSGPRARLSLVSTRMAVPAAFALVGFAATTSAVVVLGPDAASADAAYPLALATSSAPAAFTGPGQTLTLSYLITNNGDKTLYGVAVQDALVGLSPVTCPDGPLSAGTSKTCTATYVTTQADYDLTYLDDVATASGIVESEGTVVASPSANLRIPDDKPSTPLAAAQSGPDASAPDSAAGTAPLAAQPDPAAAPGAGSGGVPGAGSAPGAGAVPVAGGAPVGAAPVGAAPVGGSPVGGPGEPAPVEAGAAPAGVSPVGGAPVPVTG